MIVFKEAATATKYLEQLRHDGRRIGFAPTMGALHAGHISLIERSKQSCDITVCSIFVNPTQFNDPKDFEKYPVTLSNDILLLENASCDILFLPSVHEIYPNGTEAAHHYDLGQIEYLLEGKYRPGHFQGVCQVVHRLLSIVQPDELFMGQKDYQQCLVIKRLVQLLELPVEVITSTTFREASGLAMSSRNLRLNEPEKHEAAAIAAMLQYIKENYKKAPFSRLREYATAQLLASGFTAVDYVSIANADTLQDEDTLKPGQKLVALIAAFIGEVRLIDNMVLAE